MYRYISSLESIRRTRDACNSMLKIFDLLQLKVQVKVGVPQCCGGDCAVTVL